LFAFRRGIKTRPSQGGKRLRIGNDPGRGRRTEYDVVVLFLGVRRRRVVGKMIEI
jgi:hypothetical protein